jgi:hypothetical protein
MLTGTKAMCEEINLMHNLFLRTISFENLRISKSGIVIKVLSRITSTVIESVSLHIFSLDRPVLRDALKLPELAALFTGANSVFLECSTKLRFSIREDVDAVRESLCELDTQGRLEFI